MITITGTTKTTLEVTPKEFGQVLMEYIYKEYGLLDAGIDVWVADLYTDAQGKTYYGFDTLIHENPEVAKLVDVANILMYGEVLTRPQEQAG